VNGTEKGGEYLKQNQDLSKSIEHKTRLKTVYSIILYTNLSAAFLEFSNKLHIGKKSLIPNFIKICDTTHNRIYRHFHVWRYANWSLLYITTAQNRNCSTIYGSQGRAIAQAVSRWFPTAAARSGHVGFVVDEVALGQVFSKYFGFPCQSSFHQILRPHDHPG
jgi:hypothetical protein